MRYTLPSTSLACACLWATAAGQDQKPIISDIRPLERPSPLSSLLVADNGVAPPYREELLALHRSLIEIESITGNENKVGNFLAHYLGEHGFGVKIQELPSSASSSTAASDLKDGWKKNITALESGEGRFNLLAAPAEAIDDPKWKLRVMLSSHIDVVPPYIPYSIDGGDVSSDTQIRGRGSVDAKASIAAQVTALTSLLSAGEISPYEVMLLYVVGEEKSGDGMRFFSSSLDVPDGRLGWESIIFGEPTELKLACGHKGHLACTIAAKGKAGHSGYPWLGKSATEVLMRALIKIVDADLGSSEAFGNTTVNVGVLEGGVAANVIPESASARIAVRVAVKDHQKVLDGIDAILEEVDGEALSMTCENGYGVVECNCDVDGFESIVVNYGTDVPNLKGNHTRYLYGPGDILVAHSDHEALRVRDLEAAVEGYKKLIKHALGV